MLQQETRTVIVPHGNGHGLPSGAYILTEMYCNEPGCDCRRVMFSVFSERSKRYEAVIAYGWEAADFYARMICSGIK